MPTQQTSKSKYPSRYSPQKFVTAAQYILELVCEKQALYQKKELPAQFWKLPEWQTIFVRQLRRVHSLLKKYPESAIIATVNKYNIRTTLIPWFEDKIKVEERLLNLHPTSQGTSKKIVRPTTITFTTKKVKSNALSRLLELDNNEQT